jgi:hypothetical protein
MKKLSFFLLFYLFVLLSLFAQEELIPDKQFMLGCSYVGSSEEVTHYIDAESEVWQYSSGSFVTGGVYSSSLITVGNANFSSYDWQGFNFNWLNGSPYWSLGLYKVTNSKQPDKYYYLDARDSDFGSVAYPVDFYIYFDNSTGRYVHRTGNEQIVQGEVVRIWDIHEETPNTTGLQNYWSNVLVIVGKGKNPRLIWGPYPSTSLTINNYRVYRKYGASAWQLHTTVSSSTYEYTDGSVSLSGGQAGTDVQYKVTAVYNTSSETSASNTVIVNVQGGEIEKLGVIGNNSLAEYKLEQNYPNPFNPSTAISFSVAENSFISLKVYDVLGTEITDLVNEVKEPGNYSVSFNASKLTSGIYFYTLKANGYSLTKKMLFTK